MTCRSVSNRPIQRAGKVAARRPTVSATANAMAAPIHAALHARSTSPAPRLVPTMATRGARKPKPKGMSTYSIRELTPSPAMPAAPKAANSAFRTAVVTVGLERVQRADAADAQHIPHIAQLQAREVRPYDRVPDLKYAKRAAQPSAQ